LHAQENLVSNGSFERMEHCSSGAADLDGLIDVDAPTLGSSDIYSESCGTAPIYFYNHTYKAKDGGNFMGFGGSVALPIVYREYIQFKLNSPLEKDKFYEIGGYFKFAISMGTCFDCVEFHLSENQVFIDTACNYPFTADYTCVGKGKMYCDSINWEKITGYFSAKGGEQYLIIGCFKEDGKFSYIDYTSYIGFYYYVDSVYICKPNLYAEMPNIITPNNDGINDMLEPVNLLPNLFHYKMRIYNRWGNEVYCNDKPWDGTFMNKKCSSGIYYYVIEYFRNTDATLIKTEKGTVTVLN
jgi:gliding motility-associated-like protein